MCISQQLFPSIYDTLTHRSPSVPKLALFIILTYRYRSIFLQLPPPKTIPSPHIHLPSLLRKPPTSSTWPFANSPPLLSSSAHAPLSYPIPNPPPLRTPHPLLLTHPIRPPYLQHSFRYLLIKIDTTCLQSNLNGNY